MTAQPSLVLTSAMHTAMTLLKCEGVAVSMRGSPSHRSDCQRSGCDGRHKTIHTTVINCGVVLEQNPEPCDYKPNLSDGLKLPRPRWLVSAPKGGCIAIAPFCKVLSCKTALRT